MPLTVGSRALGEAGVDDRLGTLVSYFRTSSKAGSESIAHSSDPSRIGAYFHSLHMIIVAGIIVSAVGNDLLIAHPEQTSPANEIAGPAIYLIGNALYNKVAMAGPRARMSPVSRSLRCLSKFTDCTVQERHCSGR
jgi:low temperature requirement protein LtrA